MTEPIPATPGWVESALDRLFAPLGSDADAARDAFADCLARSKTPAQPSDQLGAEFERCHAALRRALMAAGIAQARVDETLVEAEALEAEVDVQS